MTIIDLFAFNLHRKHTFTTKNTMKKFLWSEILCTLYLLSQNPSSCHFSRFFGVHFSPAFFQVKKRPLICHKMSNDKGCMIATSEMVRDQMLLFTWAGRSARFVPLGSVSLTFTACFLPLQVIRSRKLTVQPWPRCIWGRPSWCSSGPGIRRQPSWKCTSQTLNSTKTTQRN